MRHEPKYIIRLDDACPTFTLAKWKRFFDLFEKYEIKPLIAIIPANRDPSLIVEKRSCEEFWEMTREWERKGYMLALHGYDHLYINNDAGILGYTRHSEFCTLSLEKQKEKIKKGCEIFIANGLHKPKLFIAPSHSIDMNTLRALKANGIKIISDGRYTHPYSKYGLTWIPCQLSFPKQKKSGLWTICYHPETCSEEGFALLRSFVKNNSEKFKYSEADLKPSPLKLTDHLELLKSRAKKATMITKIMNIYATIRNK